MKQLFPPQTFQQVASLLRRDPLSVQDPGLRSTMSQPADTYDLTTEQVRQNLPYH